MIQIADENPKRDIGMIKYHMYFLLTLLCGCTLTTNIKEINLIGAINIEDENFSGKLIFEKFENGDIVKKGVLNENVESGEINYNFIDLWEGSYMFGFNRSKKKSLYKVSIVSSSDDIVYEKYVLPIKGRMEIDLGKIVIHEQICCNAEI